MSTKTTFRLSTILRADAVWDCLLGVTLLLAAWPAVAESTAISTALWPAFVLTGLGSLVFGVVLARSANTSSAPAVARAAAIGNAAAVVAVVVLLLLTEPETAARAVLVLAAVGCAVFAALEWTWT
ncbi:cell division protein FtsW (lipid II flippase) [Amycolatopsis bartoniae]|uniref:Uncharacterized protein n=1 Tax=Amycolatopsis bartoniae TaxID=941986 RepID=A0A8H9M4C9_9PSEU|nr:hypothetical protein [Amycolatopsis bartoniae]MBB2934494.1 cell division protein FtsW (lipid II flippase) [Amycolatopsis bartoniae]TVT01873.1 hypothetical protein FNH07_28425 [Amycolatopsis bartoniae]GHF46994.1 hypothetical protein GCM10017566_20150 [Amycolatopsis bartoniae]